MSTVLTDEQATAVVSANILKLLKAKGWTQHELADKTGENDMMISRVVRGAHVPNIGLLSRIADAFNVSVDELLSRVPRKSVRSA